MSYPTSGDLRGRIGLLAIVSSLCLGLWTAPARAVEYRITTFADDQVPNGNCTLREALWAALLNEPVDACPAGSERHEDVIHLAVGTYPFTGGQVAFEGSGEKLRIQGTRSRFGGTTIDLGGSNRLLRIKTAFGGEPLRVALDQLELREGLAGDGFGGGALWFDGADLSIERTVFLRNQAPKAGSGGAVFYQGGRGVQVELAISDSSFLANRATAQGGALAVKGSYYDLAVDRVSFEANEVDPASTASAGGGLVVVAQRRSTVTLRQTNLFGNSARRHGGGLLVGIDPAAASGQRTTLQVSDCRFEANRTTEPGPRTFSGWAASGLGAYVRDADLEITRSSFVGNSTTAWRPMVQLGAKAEWGARLTLTNLELVASQDQALGIEAHDLTPSEGRVIAAHLTLADNLGTGYVRNQGSGPEVYFVASLESNFGPPLQIFGPVQTSQNLSTYWAGFVDSAAGDYRLGPDSPAIDEAIYGLPLPVTVDRTGISRPQGFASDIGAHERPVP